MDYVKSVNEDILLFERYVKNKKTCSDSDPKWRIGVSSSGGRGLFATSDINPNELLYIDPPLVLGPRGDIKCNPVCVGCHKKRKLFGCPKDCGLPVCSHSCSESERHLKECQLLQKWRSGMTKEIKKCEWSAQLFTAVAPIRYLLLEDEDSEIAERLQGNKIEQHNIIIDFILNNVQNGPNREEIEKLLRACEVLDAVAYETPCPQDQDTLNSMESNATSLRGMYPISALMNHDCSPNTRHCFDSKNNMIVETTKFIRRNEEITTTYTSLVWGNQTRQRHLQLTKHFECKCQRCQDPSEYGANLMGFYCIREGCPGVLLPSKYDDKKWLCNECDTKISGSKVAVLQSAIGSVIASIDMKNPRKACRLLRKKFVIPRCNQLAVELKLNINWLYGSRKGFQWSELSEDDLDLKEIFCRELLMLLQILKLEECRLKGLISYELYRTLKEKRGKGQNTVLADRLKEQKEIRQGEFKFLSDAATILKYDITSENVINEFTNAGIDVK